jgi:hypothetical protein
LCQATSADVAAFFLFQRLYGFLTSNDEDVAEARIRGGFKAILDAGMAVALSGRIFHPSARPEKDTSHDQGR